MKARNKDLRTRVAKLTVAAVDLLNRQMKSREYPMRTYARFSFKEAGFEMREEARVDFGLVVLRFSDEIRQLSEFIECAGYMVKNQTIRRDFIVVDKDGKRVEKLPLDSAWTSPLCPFLQAYFNAVGSLIFDEVKFGHLYMGLERYIYAKVQEYSVSSPLMNFLLETPKTDLGKGLKIRQVSEEEKSEYLTMMQWSIGTPSFPIFDVADVKYVLETTYLRKKRTPIETSSCQEILQDVVTVLRLFKSGSVDACVVRITPISWQPHGGSVFVFQTSHTSPFGQKYVLFESEAKAFRRLWRSYTKFRTERAMLRSNKYVGIAIRRFETGIRETDFENKMVDYLISLEALYLLERQELTHRLSNRVATLLGKEEKETEKIRNTVEKAYELRSDIVHGKDVRPIKIEGRTIEPDNLASIIEECVRKSIRSFIALSKTYRTQKSIIDELDTSLFNRKSRKRLHRLAKF